MEYSHPSSKISMELSQNNNNSSSNKTQSCYICGKYFAQKYTLQTHIRTIHKTNPHKCDHCDLSFVSSLELKKHAYKSHNISSRKNNLCIDSEDLSDSNINDQQKTNSAHKKNISKKIYSTRPTNKKKKFSYDSEEDSALYYKKSRAKKNNNVFRKKSISTDLHSDNEENNNNIELESLLDWDELGLDSSINELSTEEVIPEKQDENNNNVESQQQQQEEKQNPNNINNNNAVQKLSRGESILSNNTLLTDNNYQRSQVGSLSFLENGILGKQFQQQSQQISNSLQNTEKRSFPEFRKEKQNEPVQWYVFDESDDKLDLNQEMKADADQTHQHDDLNYLLNQLQQQQQQINSNCMIAENRNSYNGYQNFNTNNNLQQNSFSSVFSRNLF